MQLIVGDIHGCHAEFLELLDRAGVGPEDEIIAIGDIVDRGPDSRAVLDFFRQRPKASSILGNHERKHLRSARGEIEPAVSQAIVRRELGDDYSEYLSFMETWPRHRVLPEAILVHGFWEPGVPLEQQRDNVVVGTMSGEQYLKEHYGWPWYEYYDGPLPLIVGHRHYRGDGEPLVWRDRVFALDTGCCYGFRLTGLVLPEFRFVTLPARANHWEATRRRYPDLTSEQSSQNP